MNHIQADPPPVQFLNLHWGTFCPSDVRHKQRAGQELRAGFQPPPETLFILSPKVLVLQPPFSQGVPGDGPAVLPTGLLGSDLFSHVSAGELYLINTRLQVTWLIPLNEGESDKRFPTAKGGGVGSIQVPLYMIP